MDALIQLKTYVAALAHPVSKGAAEEIGFLLTDLEKEAAPAGPAASMCTMMHSLVRYLISRNKTAHPETLATLAAMAQDLERLLAGAAENPEQLLADRIKAFKAFRATAAKVPDVSAEELESLEAAILSIDWEISEATLLKFNQVLSGLKDKFNTASKLHYGFLAIMHSLGSYIAKNRADAHTGALTLLSSVFADFARLVQARDMTPEEKREMLRADMAAYNEFKTKVLSRPAPEARPAEAAPATSAVPAPEFPPAADTGEDIGMEEEVLPALSHVARATSRQSAAPLSLLPDTPDELPRPRPSAQRRPQGPGSHPDIMGDLLSVKDDSPADKLLEAIHLAELHGPDQENAPMASEEALAREGIQSFTPRRMDSAPIPEIQDRLDGFFNLDWQPEDAGDDTPASEGRSDWLEQDLEEALGDASFHDTLPGEEPDGYEIPDDGIVLIPEEPADEEAIPEDPAGEEILPPEPLPDPAALVDELSLLLADPDDLKRPEVFESADRLLLELRSASSSHSVPDRLAGLIQDLARHLHSRTEEASGAGPVTPAQDPLETELTEADLAGAAIAAPMEALAAKEDEDDDVEETGDDDLSDPAFAPPEDLSDEADLLSGELASPPEKKGFLAKFRSLFKK